MKRQSGATLGGLIMFLILLILVLYTATRIVPAYVDYWLVERSVKTLQEMPSLESRSDEDIRGEFDKQLRLNNVTLVKRSDLLVERLPTGVRLSAAFSVKRPYFGPLSLCLDFQAGASGGN